MPVIEIKDATIAYTDAGRGETVMLIHGSASSRRMWQPLVGRLAARYRVVAPDLVGYGDSTPWRDGLQATDFDVIATFVRELGCPRHIVGHSYGGALALGAALALGDRVASLALVEPAAFQVLHAGAGAALAEIEALASRHIGLVAERDLETCAAHFMGYWIGAGTWASMPVETRARLTATMPKIASEFRLMFRSRDRFDGVRGLRVPTLLLRGAHTTPAARAVVDWLAAVIPNAGLVEVADAGHMLPVTHARRVNAAIETHLAQAEAETSFAVAA